MYFGDVYFIDLNQHTLVTSNENARRFLAGPTEAALLADSTVRGFAISFFTSRRVASLNALFFLLGGITPDHVTRRQTRTVNLDQGGKF